MLQHHHWPCWHRAHRTLPFAQFSFSCVLSIYVYIYISIYVYYLSITLLIFFAFLESSSPLPVLLTCDRIRKNWLLRQPSNPEKVRHWCEWSTYPTAKSQIKISPRNWLSFLYFYYSFFSLFMVILLYLTGDWEIGSDFNCKISSCFKVSFSSPFKEKTIKQTANATSESF